MKVTALVLSLAIPCALPAHAKMIASKMVPAEKVAAYLEKQKKERPLGELEKQALSLARIGAALGAKVSRSPVETEEESLPRIGAADVAASLHGAIPADWAKSPSPKVLKLLRKDRKLLESYLGASSAYDWAWVRYELGEKTEAKTTVGGLFDAEYDRVMKLEKSVTTFGHGPLTDAELYVQALKPLSTPAEAKALDDKLQKLKVHVSNLPQSMIMT